MIPQDPIILLSFINMKLRDNYKDLEALAEGLDISSNELSEIVDKLKAVGYEYNAEQNQFV
jgi:biotin operon repressor